MTKATRTAARLLDMDLPSLRRDALAFQLVSPVRAEAGLAARASVGEHGARAAEAMHRALEDFAPGGLVRDAGDLLVCIELRALVDEHFGPWIVPEYAAQVVMRPVKCQECVSAGCGVVPYDAKRAHVAKLRCRKGGLQARL